MDGPFIEYLLILILAEKLISAINEAFSCTFLYIELQSSQKVDFFVVAR